MSKDIGITVTKNDDFSEWYTQVVLKAELADYAPVKGLIVLRPDGYSIWESIKLALDEKFKNLKSLVNEVKVGYTMSEDDYQLLEEYDLYFFDADQPDLC